MVNFFKYFNLCKKLIKKLFFRRAASRQSDIALSLIFPDNTLQTVAIDQWTTCEEAAGLSLAMITQGFQTQGWSVVMEEGGIVTDTCGLDYVLDLVGEKELLPAFPAIKNDLFKTKRQSGPLTPTRSNDMEPTSPVKKRPQNKPPDPPYQRNSTSSDLIVSTDQILTRNSVDKMEREEIHAVYAQRQEGPNRKNSIDLLSRSSALNERYFDIEKSRSRSMDNLMNSDTESQPQIPEVVVEPLSDLGLSHSKLNERYHSVERLAPLKQPAPRHLKPPPVNKRMDSYGKFMERNEMLIRSSAMSDTSEAPSLASHVRRLRVPSQASDVDQFLDDLFSPVLDTQLDELSDARSLAASIRGGDDFRIYSEAPIFLNDDINTLENVNMLCRVIKGGGSDDNNPLPEDQNVDEYITDLFQPIFLNENIRNLGEMEELVDSIKGGAEDMNYQHQAQRAFLQSAMQQNLHIQQQLMAQNQALQSLLGQQAEERAQGGSKVKIQSNEKIRKPQSNDGSFSVPPPPPPMPPENLWADPLEARPFLDPYGRAKTVRIGKWRWPPLVSGDHHPADAAENFISFKMRQNQRKMTPQAHHGSNEGIEWDEYDSGIISNGNHAEKSKEKFKSDPQLNKSSAIPAAKYQKRSFDIGAERPIPGSVGKLKLSTEMRQRLEQVTAGHSVRSTTSNKSEAPAKLDDTRRMMLEQQLGGMRKEIPKSTKPFMPPPSIAPPPPPIRPLQNKEKIPSFVQRHERDTFGVKDFNDSWGRAEVAKLDAMYDPNRRSRSHSRERENFSESVWDRSEVEGPPSNGKFHTKIPLN